MSASSANDCDAPGINDLFAIADTSLSFSTERSTSTSRDSVLVMMSRLSAAIPLTLGSLSLDAANIADSILGALASDLGL